MEDNPPFINTGTAYTGKDNINLETVDLFAGFRNLR